jgi:hypothetical protein
MKNNTVQPKCNKHSENLRIAAVVEQIIEHAVSHKERKASVYERAETQYACCKDHKTQIPAVQSYPGHK